MTVPAFDRAVALTCAWASAAAYELDDGKRHAMLAAKALQERGFIQARSAARLLVVETLAGDVIWAHQGTQFDRREVASIDANFDFEPVAQGGGLVMRGYRRQLEALAPRFPELPVPTIITGHSAGGSEANQNANTLALELCRKSPRLPRLVTFGAPRCADAAFWANAPVRPMRIERESDPAPRWPLDTPFVQPDGVWWLHDGGIQLCGHRPTLTDMATGWQYHPIIESYIAALEALPA
jgi:lipase (class 3)